MILTELERWRSYLAIDGDDLDRCLMQQPETYHHVSEHYFLAVSQRDEAKLLLDEGTADVDKHIRGGAAKTDERITEAAILNRIKVSPIVKGLTRKYLATKQTADRWDALRSAFEQRSRILQKLVDLRLNERRDLKLEGGGYAREATQRLAARNLAAASEIRRSRRGDADSS